MTDASKYVTGTPHPNSRRTARYETRPPSYDAAGRYNTGAGYARWRSYETDPTSSVPGKRDVYVAVHRLLAVVACYDTDTPLAEVLSDLAGKDVHHESGVPWDNRPDNLTVIDHGRHSEITQTQRRAWAEDAKRDVQRREQQPLGGVTRCAECDVDLTDAVDATFADTDATYCLTCAKERADGRRIEV